jgi:glycosyltransferase involved in cell wall biosynthesis
MKTALLVSPRFPPLNAADHQRVRTMLPHLRGLGWDPVVLALRTEPELGAQEPELAAAAERAARVERAAPLPLGIARLAGVSSLGARGFVALRRAGARLIRELKPDVAFFSTTEFLALPLGLRWRRQFGLPYVVDWQDPWLSTYYDEHPAVPRPGGRLKYGAQQALARWLEPAVARGAAHHVTVSRAYGDALVSRYGAMAPFTEIPFAASLEDFALAARAPAATPAPGPRYWLCAGRGGEDLEFSLGCLFRALARARQAQPRRWGDLVLWFVGTSYAPAGRERGTVASLAARCGVADQVREMPQRVGYLEALRLMRGAEALLVPGSDDPDYSPSKLVTCASSGRPVLGVLHARSPAHAMAPALAGAVLVPFSREAGEGAVVDELMRRWFEADLGALASGSTRAVPGFEAAQMTARIAAILDAVAAP